MAELQLPLEGRNAIRRIAALGVLLILLILAGSGALMGFAADAVDQLQARQERLLVSRSLARFQERLSRDLTTVTVWEQAYDILLPGGDLAWADAEVGSYLARNRGHDWSVVVDARNRPFYAWQGERRVDPATLASQLRDSGPILQAIREAELRPDESPERLEAVDPRFARTAEAIVQSDGHYYVVGASTVAQETADAPRRPGPAVVVISGQRMEDFLILLNEELEVRGAQVAPAPPTGENSLPLKDIEGRPIGALAWKAAQPGWATLRQAGPLFLLGLIILMTVGAALVVHIRGIALKLDAHEKGHRDAMRDLLRARDEAQAANRAKSEFLAHMSHEIRTPLNGIIGMVQAMERSGLGSPHQERLEVVRDFGQTLLAVLNDILDLSKIEAGRVELDVGEFDLRQTVEMVCRPLANLAAQKGLDLHVELEPEALGVWRGDAMRIRQILSNLLSNAVKFTERGEVRVNVKRTVDGLSFAVKDSGIGIPADRLPQLFEKFTQADSSTTRRFGGTGLGLAICREFVSIMGGELTARSADGEGSTFTFTLPLPKVRDTETEARADALSTEDPVTLRILAAEDNRANQMVLKALLEPLGARLTVVGDGRQAVEAAQRGLYDLILMDVQMPVMDGVAATAAIRLFEAEKARPRTPILALSANVMDHQTAEYIAAGMDGAVAKPIDASALFEALRTVLDQSRAQAA